jgi:multidrug efflux pump
VISLTVSLIAVFIPLLFMSGLVGRMFREFALTLTIAVVTSAIVSLTLTPMMCSRLLKYAGEELTVPGLATISHGIDRMVEFYHRTLLLVLEHQRATMVFTFATIVATLLLYVVAPKGFLPLQDTASITAVTEAGPDVSFAEMQSRQTEIADAIKADPDVTGVVSVIGAGSVNPTTNVGRLAMTLKPRGERRDDVSVVIARLRGRVASIPGMTVYFQAVQDVQISTQSSRSQYQYTLTGTDSDLVMLWSKKLVAELRRDPLFRDVSSEAQDGGLRAALDVNRQRAGQLGVSLQAITDTLNDAFAQRQISTIYGQANQYRVVLEALPMYQRDPSILSKLYLPGTLDAQVPLSAIATLTRTTAPLAISHQAQFPAISLSFNLAPGAALGDAVDEVKTIETRIGMPTSIVGLFAGDAAEFSKSLAGQPWLILAAIVTIYIVLGVLYESYIHPITILSTLPSAGVGAILALMLFGQDLSVIGLIGIILLMGIVKKNAIMMIDFALEAERRQGLPASEAIVQACLLRFRPIMMTTLAALFGALPLAVESGTGAELRFPLGISIIGGLLLSQLLTLYTTPVIYLALDRVSGKIKKAVPPAGPELPLPPVAGAAEGMQ